MTLLERNELIYALGLNYLIEKGRNKIWQRENSESYTYAKGKLLGACMALKLNFEETTNTLTIFTANKKKIAVKVEIED